MRMFIPALGFVAAAFAMAPVPSDAAACARGMYRAGCVGPRGAVGVGPRGAYVGVHPYGYRRPYPYYRPHPYYRAHVYRRRVY